MGGHRAPSLVPSTLRQAHNAASTTMKAIMIIVCSPRPIWARSSACQAGRQWRAGHVGQLRNMACIQHRWQPVPAVLQQAAGSRPHPAGRGSVHSVPSRPSSPQPCQGWTPAPRSAPPGCCASAAGTGRSAEEHTALVGGPHEETRRAGARRRRLAPDPSRHSRAPAPFPTPPSALPSQPPPTLYSL